MSTAEQTRAKDVSQPLVSVVVPVYKVERWLDRCMASIVGQTYGNLEIILVDDGSPDGSPAKCDAWAERDARVTVLHRANAGVSAARNAGMDAAHGDYLCFVDSDDVIEPNLVATALDAAQSHDAQIVFFANTNDHQRSDGTVLDSVPQPGVAFVATTAGEFAQHIVQLSHAQYVCPPWNKLFLTSFVRGVGSRFPEGIIAGEDSAFNFPLYAAAERVVSLDQPLYRYSMRAGSAMGTYDARLLHDRTAVHAMLLPIVKSWAPSYLNEHENRLIANVWIMLSLLYADGRPQVKAQRGAIVRTIITDPVVRDCARQVRGIGRRNQLVAALVRSGNVWATRLLMSTVATAKRIMAKRGA